jgi:protein-ribulosamine 3-kinase
MSSFEKIGLHIGERIISDSSIGGGCIGDSRVVKTDAGNKYFLKSYGTSSGSIIKNEANGLEELAKSNTIHIPQVIYSDDQFLLLEYIEQSSRVSIFSELFGQRFAKMHKYTSEEFGFYENNFIGATPQINIPKSEKWSTFYWENRLLYQFKLAERNNYSSTELHNLFSILENRIESIIEGSEEEPTILHGDLWGGNYIVDEKGEPCLIDPAVYYGHREADLAMTMLFGGFDSKFYNAYDEAYPLKPGWRNRIDIYKLYHVMNHLNLFGASYYSQVISILKKYTS